MNQKDTVLIVYPPGGYGTFVEWLLTYFSGEIAEDQLPFKENGSSHNFYGNPIGPTNKESVADYFNSNNNYRYARSHASNDDTKHIYGWTVEQFVSPLIGNLKKVVLLTTAEDSRLLVLNNALDKTTRTLEVVTAEVIKTLKDQFDVVGDVADWQLREMWSYWFNRMQQLQVVAFQPVQHDQIVNVSVRDLVDNFEPTVKQLFNSLEIKMVRTDTLPWVGKKWMELQTHSQIDSLCSKIIDAVVADRLFEWSKLQLHEEGFIQYQLRDLHKLDLLCYNLNVFPTNSVELRKLLINV